MNLSVIQWYVIIINVLAFLLFSLDFLIYKHGGEGVKPKWLPDIIAVIGGALGVCIAFLVWDRKIKKSNITWRVFAVCLFLIQLVIYLILCGPKSGAFKMYFISLYNEHRILIWYLLAINIVTFALFVIDKIKAIRGKWRIRELVLLGFSFIGGSIGGILAMYICRHKIKSPQFKIGMPMIIVVQVLLLGYLRIANSI